MIDFTIESEPGAAQTGPTFSEPPASLNPGEVLRDRYVLQARLGSGHRGTVFKALDRFRTTLPETQRYVALKILHAGLRGSEESLAGLRLEFHCAQLLSHPNIVNVYELDRAGDLIFFTMEMLDGEPLSHVMKRLRPGAMGESQAWELIRQLGAGLAHAHERGVVHGDLNPEDIFITREGELRILNFGTNRLAEPKLHADHPDVPSVDKKRAYASCEQLEGRHADPRDDLYSLACVSYELLTGVHPFGSRPATLARDYRVSLARPRGLSGRQWRALQQGLAWHRGGRSISVRAWMHRFIRGSGRDSSLTPLQDLTVPQRLQPRVPWRAAAAVVVITLATAAVATRLRSTVASKTIDPPASVLAVAPTRIDASVPPDAGSAIESVVPSDGVAIGKEGAPGVPQGKAAPKAISRAISVEPSQVKAEDHFAEIRLHRDVLQKNGSFTWWTEPATAKAGVDYAPEAVAIQTFPSGYRTTRLYVRLLPQALRSQRSYFYVAISQPSPHDSAPTVIRRQIWLPTSSSLQARR